MRAGKEEGHVRAEEYADHLDALTHELKSVIVGQDEVIGQMITALSAGGHVLLEGVPGIAKTLLIQTLARCIEGSFARIQFTPDLLPADITGTRIFRQTDGCFTTVRGPIFHHFVLADEINRAPPKVQSALLEAMQERQVTIQGDTFPLEDPFFVLATQNPIESEGTYPLPEAQTDRFMFKVLMGYPSLEEEVTILDRFTGESGPEPRAVTDIATLLAIRSHVRSIRADRSVKEYAASIVDATRHPAALIPDMEGYIAFGASPRASLSLILGAKGRAVMQGRTYIVPHDVKEVAHPSLRHRIIRTYEAEAEGVSTDRIIDRILQNVPVP
ncbi:AAA family ATPase [Methanofollis fontis]|uniref:ATPase n=1 Tax=Methanofollis fontis TaxID=2052832 RepID=A0A483CZN8_9EURY|nr:MoxR family ATPase [Methanofollis fontis]TAJ45892.1 ATPase [Methanofollis fontis]